MAQENTGLLIASLVAIVAVVGLVILFSGARAGAANFKYVGPQLAPGQGPCVCPEGSVASFQGRSGQLAGCSCRVLPSYAPGELPPELAEYYQE